MGPCLLAIVFCMLVCCKTVLTSINDDEPVAVTLEDGVAALAMAEAATQSQSTGKSIQLKEVL